MQSNWHGISLPMNSNLKKDRLWVTIFEEMMRLQAFGLKRVGVPANRLVRLGKKV
ncbi:MAG: hypothetical protein Ct9H90mP13_13870 [Pseudomonadota bacterium]|nr:MAG: hypothetical protein Ct9H90mP13_13870 [Pseudomonadota bacterium]